MARLKRDHIGYRSSGLWTKYQQPAISERPARRIKKKNTKKWCKGKVGRKHSYVRVERHEFMTFVWSLNRCVSCGRKQYSSQ